MPANATMDFYWSSLFAKLLEKRSVDDLVAYVGTGGSDGAAAPAVEEKKEESDDDMEYGLFD